MKINSLEVFVLLMLLSSLTFAQEFKNVFVPSGLSTGNTVVPSDKAYYKYKLSDRNIELIYSQENIKFAKHTADIQNTLHDNYENFYDWKLDETLYIGLISDCNQIANAFSTQWPNNRQINYMGGTISVDHFASTSWLNLLLYHETAHNYQLNTKASKVSQGLHSVFGNATFLLPLPLIIPNSAENSFMLEGNAVLNESWHGDGGRLYSGRFKAMTILQAKAGNIKPELMYNNIVKFPYSGDIHYHIGGFYNLYLAKKYGLEKLNSYFKNKSKDWIWPYFTNSSLKNTIGLDFEKSLSEYADIYAKQAKDFVLAKGKKIASTQFYSQISSNEEEIFFITNETGYSTPELIVFNKESHKLSKFRDSWLSGKVIKVDDKYYTQGSKNISPTKISQGLFDNNAFIKDTTSSKMVQGYLSNGSAVYFDVASSYDYPKLYIDDAYYTFTNSSVFIDKDDNLYYFSNKAKQRTLYKNKQALFTYEGFYGIVSDVDSDGAVYFIANSKFGSSLFKYSKGKVTRVSDADNIIQARLINDKEVLLCAISTKDYYYVKNKLSSVDEKPYDTKLFFEEKSYYAKHKIDSSETHKHDNLDTSKHYNSLFNLHYSGTDFTLGSSSDTSYTGVLNMKFSDPLSQNSANIFISKDYTGIAIAGVGYENTQNILQYSVSGYGVVDDNKRKNIRDYGIIANAKIPFYNAGYYQGFFNTSFYQDYETLSRNPLTLSFSFARFERYAKSMYPNYVNALSLYGVKEEEDIIAGGTYQFSHELKYETYFKVAGKFSITDLDNFTAGARGVKLSQSAFEEDFDISSIYMPTLDNTLYLKRASYVEAALVSVVNLSSYWFTFPLSLQREAIYLKYKYYDLEDFASNHESLSEITAGLRFDTTVLNVMPITISLDYLYNDTNKEVITKNNNQYRFTLGSTF